MGEVRVTVPVGSATSKIPESASRMERINNWVAAVLSAEGGNCKGRTHGTRRICVRYAACKLAAKSARRPKELDEFEVRDDLSSYKIRSSGEGGVKEPFKTGANEVACGGVVLVGAGAGGAVGTTVG